MEAILLCAALVYTSRIRLSARLIVFGRSVYNAVRKAIINDRVPPDRESCFKKKKRGKAPRVAPLKLDKSIDCLLHVRWQKLFAFHRWIFLLSTLYSIFDNARRVIFYFDIWNRLKGAYRRDESLVLILSVVLLFSAKNVAIILHRERIKAEIIYTVN